MQPHTESEHVLDELLVIRCQEGSRKAFEQLVTRWQELLWRHAFRLTAREDAAWDVMQESWIAVTKGIRKLRDPGSFRRWAYTIVTRAATNRLRRSNVLDTIGVDALEELSVDDSERSEREQAVAQLRAALRQLPGDQRGLLCLRYFESFELWELAEIFGVPEGTVKSRLHHARQTGARVVSGSVAASSALLVAKNTPKGGPR